MSKNDGCARSLFVGSELLEVVGLGLTFNFLDTSAESIFLVFLIVASIVPCIFALEDLRRLQRVDSRPDPSDFLATRRFLIIVAAWFFAAVNAIIWLFVHAAAASFAAVWIPAVVVFFALIVSVFYAALIMYVSARHLLAIYK